MADFIQDINETDGLYLKGFYLNGPKKLECVFIHAELYDILASEMRNRIPYNQKKTLYELYNERNQMCIRDRGDVDDKILNYQLGVKIGVIDDLFHQDKMEFKNADKIMNQIRNKEELPKPVRMTLERYLRLYDVFESILNYQCRADEENPQE